MTWNGWWWGAQAQTTMGLLCNYVPNLTSAFASVQDALRQNISASHIFVCEFFKNVRISIIASIKNNFTVCIQYLAIKK